MKVTQGNTLQSLRGVLDFLDKHAPDLPAVAGCGARKRLDAQVAELNSHAGSQSAGHLIAIGATQRLHALRFSLLYDHMLPIARIVRAELHFVPELEPFKMPRGRPSTERLYAMAGGMADAAAPHAGVFTNAGLPDDFLAQLCEAAAAMRRALDRRTESRSVRSGATRGLAVTMSDALKTVRVLDAFVQRALRHDPAMLAGWNSVRRPQVKPVRTAADADAALKAA